MKRRIKKITWDYFIHTLGLMQNAYKNNDIIEGDIYYQEARGLMRGLYFNDTLNETGYNMLWVMLRNAYKLSH